MIFEELPTSIQDRIQPQQYEVCLELLNKSYDDNLNNTRDTDLAEMRAYTDVYNWIEKMPKPEELHVRFNKFVQFTKIDSMNRTVSGIFTDETPDKTGEICDYDSSKPHYQNWSNEFAKTTGGQSLGNIREMHGLSAAGKVTDLLFDDTGKSISGTAKIVDDNAWKKCMEGVYTGFSHGGDYVGGLKQEKSSDGQKTYKRYTAKPSEISLVDNPANPNAHFQFVKADGTIELRKFQTSAMKEEVDMEKVEMQKLVEELMELRFQDLLTKNNVTPILKVDATAQDICPTCQAPKGKCACSTTKPTDLQKEKDSVAVLEGKTVRTKPSDEEMALAVTVIFGKVIGEKYGLTPEQVDKVFEGSMEKGGDGSGNWMHPAPVTAGYGSNGDMLGQAAQQQTNVAQVASTNANSVAQQSPVPPPPKKPAPKLVDAAATAAQAHDKASKMHLDAANAHQVEGNKDQEAHHRAMADQHAQFASQPPPGSPPPDPNAQKAVTDGMKKGMNTVSRLATLLLDMAWLKWSVMQEQEAEGDKSSTLSASLQSNIESTARTLLDMAGEETKELIASLTAGKPPEESRPSMNPIPFFCAMGEDQLHKAVEPEEWTFGKAVVDSGGKVPFYLATHERGYGGYAADDKSTDVGKPPEKEKTTNGYSGYEGKGPPNIDDPDNPSQYQQPWTGFDLVSTEIPTPEYAFKGFFRVM